MYREIRTMARWVSRRLAYVRYVDISRSARRGGYDNDPCPVLPAERQHTTNATLHQRVAVPSRASLVDERPHVPLRTALSEEGAPWRRPTRGDWELQALMTMEVAERFRELADDAHPINQPFSAEEQVARRHILGDYRTNDFVEDLANGMLDQDPALLRNQEYDSYYSMRTPQPSPSTALTVPPIYEPSDLPPYTSTNSPPQYSLKNALSYDSESSIHADSITPATTVSKNGIANGIEHKNLRRKGRIPWPQEQCLSVKFANEASKQREDLEEEDFAEAYMRAMHHHTPPQVPQRHYSRQYQAYSRSGLPSRSFGLLQAPLAVETPIVDTRAPTDEREQPHVRSRHQRSLHPPLAYPYPAGDVSLRHEPVQVAPRTAPTLPRTNVHLRETSHLDQQTRSRGFGNERSALRISTGPALANTVPTQDVSVIDWQYHSPLAADNIVSPALRPTRHEGLRNTRSSCQSPISYDISSIYTALEAITSGASQLHQRRGSYRHRTASTNDDVHIGRQSSYGNLCDTDRRPAHPALPESTSAHRHHLQVPTTAAPGSTPYRMSNRVEGPLGAFDWESDAGGLNDGGMFDDFGG
ncbi:MAG: hypothetical protein Q9197_006201 [Variospora fuerteventurae]